MTTGPEAGYYADPSIPGYIRYWDGTQWVAGTSRPAPSKQEEPPADVWMPGGSEDRAQAQSQAGTSGQNSVRPLYPPRTEGSADAWPGGASQSSAGSSGGG